MKYLLKPLLFIFLLVQSTISFSQIPLYSSYPSASATIFLDFDGQLVQNTSWNWSGPLELGASGMSSSQITEIFNRVSEDYRPFDINVTTDSTVYWAAPATKRTRVILTISSSWYGAAGGVAYVNSFTWGDNTPCFVFTALLGYNTKYVAEAASHEAGHTLGLRHQSSYDNNCVKTAEYNPGIGAGEIAWAPIMGVGYYRNFTLWNNGANPYGCTSYQDDLSIITSSLNGFGYRDDDHSNNPGGSATHAIFSNNHFNVSGVVEKISDKDHFRFSLPVNGQFKLNAIPYNIGTGNIGSNLDMQVSLMVGNTVIGTYNPGSILNVFIDTFLVAGNYTIKVEGKGNTYAPEYASLGSYSLDATYLPFGVLPVRAVELKGQKEKNNHLFNWVIDADEKLVQQEIQVSANGVEFTTIGKLSVAARSFTYLPKYGGRLQYRLHVEFEDGSQYYSNIVSLESAVKQSIPALESTLLYGSAFIMSPFEYHYTVTDLNGRMMMKGTLLQGRNQLDISHLSKGMYLLQYTNNNEQFTEKFIKQ